MQQSASIKKKKEKKSTLEGSRSQRKAAKQQVDRIGYNWKRWVAERREATWKLEMPAKLE